MANIISPAFSGGDGSWHLKVKVTNLDLDKELRVRGDLHIGGVMLRLVEELGMKRDWSDYALWWPEKNKWLLRTKWTLDQYGAHADSKLEFTPMHKQLRIQLPDLRYVDLMVDVSVKVFRSVAILCKDLGIRHPEELSFLKPLEPEDLRYNFSDDPRRKKLAQEIASNGKTPVVSPDTNAYVREKALLNHSQNGHDRNYERSYSPFGTMNANGTLHNSRFDSSLNHIGGMSNTGWSCPLATTPASLTSDARRNLLRPKSLVEKARINVSWLDSSLSLKEQGIQEYETVWLRCKFYNFYDLNPKYDPVRINQVYEQAKAELFAELVDCTEEEMLMFAALQHQATIKSRDPAAFETDEVDGQTRYDEDEIDQALSELQATLEGSTLTSTPLANSGKDITSVPELGDFLRFAKPKTFGFKSFKKYWATCHDQQIYLYKNREDAGRDPVYHLPLKGCEVAPDVNLSSGKYGIKVEVPSEEGMTEVHFRCDNEEQYAKWMAAIRLASRGKTLADSSYAAEKKSILAFLSMQHPAPAPTTNSSGMNSVVELNPEEYVPQRFLRRAKTGKLVQRILEAHANVKDLSLCEAKMNYIRAWQSLPDHGVTLFVVRFRGPHEKNKDELLGVAPNRLMRMDLNSGHHIKTWRLNTMKSWRVNWETQELHIEFDNETVILFCSSAACKVVHEFIGGYIFLSMRSKDVSQNLNEEMFHKLTCGWV
ncbi:unnamed protein product [Notodromas monacha]|uniref:PH domain-containing protein n=1 Tax=Notodromas monacha TaxID=399045 RepID=A0A7R9BNE4_9CRUS|nr:unnamed protein product [Notodromas monacha]CAG0917340.1 unnamed protein product [Notodromas monacha]